MRASSANANASAMNSASSSCIGDDKPRPNVPSSKARPRLPGSDFGFERSMIVPPPPVIGLPVLPPGLPWSKPSSVALHPGPTLSCGLHATTHACAPLESDSRAPFSNAFGAWQNLEGKEHDDTSMEVCPLTATMAPIDVKWQFDSTADRRGEPPSSC